MMDSFVEITDRVQFVCKRHPELLENELVKKAIDIRRCDICKDGYYKNKSEEVKEDEQIKARDEWVAVLRRFYIPPSV